MVALPSSNIVLLAAIGFLTGSAHPAIPALADPENSGVIVTGADRSVDAAWSLTIYSKPDGNSDSITFNGASSSLTECKDTGGSSFSFDNLCDPMAQVGFELQTFSLGDCEGVEKESSSTTEPVIGIFRSWRVVGTNEC